MKDLSRRKKVFVNVLYIILPLIWGGILLFTFCVGLLGTWFIFNNWLLMPEKTGLDARVVYKISKWIGLLGGVFLAYLSCFWMARVFPPPPPYVIWRLNKKSLNTETQDEKQNPKSISD